MRFWTVWLLLVIAFITLLMSAQVDAQSTDTQSIVVLPGDTWPALAWRYELSPADLEKANLQFNKQRQPTIGSMLTLPKREVETTGRIVRSGDGGLLQTAFRQNLSPWLMAMRNNMPSPYHPLFFRPIFVPSETEIPRDFPLGFENLELSQLVGFPGQALAYRAQNNKPISVTAQLNGIPIESFSNGLHLVGLFGTGAFFGSGEPELMIQVDNGPLWSQPWRFEDSSWFYDQITLTGTAAAIDQESIAQERARLFELWSMKTPTPLWTKPFKAPLTNYLEFSSFYGSRRSYNGGPYSTYHEGVDFSAYGGTEVYASAAGIVSLAEPLYVRGNAVIIDHGLGIYSGYYHLSSLAVESGQIVEQGQLIGLVGTTGLSTGNHLHWDFLVGGTWVDATAWVEQGMACWILAGLGKECQS